MNAPHPVIRSFLRSLILAVGWSAAIASGFLGGVASGQSTPVGFSYIPGGTFRTGDRDNVSQWITVTVGSFYLQERETTKTQWDEVIAWAVNNGYSDLAAGEGKALNHPVYSVSWWDAVKWCNARSEKEGLTPVYTVGGAVMRTGTTEPIANWTENGYRLPTEAEWEKAARGGVRGMRFPWGTDTISHEWANYRGSSAYSYDQGRDFHRAFDTGGSPYTSPVGSFAANGYGLYDMSGNVHEWCWDWYGGYTTSDGTTNPRGPASGSSRVLRGGSWDGFAIDARCAARSLSTPGSTLYSVGFRPARSAIGLSINADLSALTLSSGTLSPGFASGTISYTASVSNGTTSITVTPTLAQTDAMIDARVNTNTYAAVRTDSPSASLPLNVGSNTVDVRVTAQDGTTQKTYTVTVTRDKATQSITFANPGNQLANATVNLTAEGGDSGNPVTFTVEGPATLVGNVLSFTGAGSVTVRANQDGNDLYHPAPEVSQTFTVTKTTATISLGNLSQTYDGTPKSATATTDPVGKTVTFTYEGSATAPTNAGSYAVVGTINDPIYEGSTSSTLFVAKAAQTITFAPIPAQLGNNSVKLSASGGESGQPPVFVVESGPAVLREGNILTFTGAGEVRVRASQAGNSDFNPATDVTHTFNVVLPQPDVAVGLSLDSLVGIRSYGNPGQQLNLVSRFARPVTGFAILANRTILPGRRAEDRLAVRANPGNRFFRVTYSDVDGNATAGIVSGFYRTPAIDGTDAIRWITARISPNRALLAAKKGRRTVYLRKTFKTTVRASSTLYPPASDSGVIRVSHH